MYNFGKNICKLQLTICLVFLLLISINAFSQNEDSREYISFGFKAGINFSSIYNSHTENFHARGKAGFAGGAFLYIPIAKYIGIQPEVLLSQRGFNSSGIYLLNSYELKRTLNYVDIPIFFAVKPIERLTILFGPQYSFLMSQSNVFTNSSLNRFQEDQFKSEPVRHNIFCLTGGLDFNFNNVVFGLRTGWDVTHNRENSSSQTPRYKNIWLQASVGFRIY